MEDLPKKPKPNPNLLTSSTVKDVYIEFCFFLFVPGIVRALGILMGYNSKVLSDCIFSLCLRQCSIWAFLYSYTVHPFWFWDQKTFPLGRNQSRVRHCSVRLLLFCNCLWPAVTVQVVLNWCISHSFSPGKLSSLATVLTPSKVSLKSIEEAKQNKGRKVANRTPKCISVLLDPFLVAL